MRSIAALFAVMLFTGLTFGQYEGGRRLVDTERHVVTVSKRGDLVAFIMEAIADFTEDRDNSKPQGLGWDFSGIRVDVNNNNLIDNRVDLGFGTRQKSHIFCPQYLVHENASSLCGGLRSKGSVKVEFRSTSLQKVAHPVFTYVIPFAELNRGGGKIGLVFEFGDPKEGVSYYPSRRRPRSFDETILLDLSEM